MFLTKSELKTVKLQEVVNLITNSDDTIIEELIADNISIMSDSLRQYYDVEAIFAAEDGDRSRTVLKYLKHLVVNDLFIIRSHEIPQAVEKMYNEAMAWLERVEKGQTAPDLPKIKDEEGNDKPFIKFGSRKKYPTSF